MVFHSAPSTPLESSLADGVPRVVAPSFYCVTNAFVSMKVHHAPASSARNVSSSAASRTTASRNSVVNFGFTRPQLHVLLQITYFYRLMVVYHDEFPEPTHYPEPFS